MNGRHTEPKNKQEYGQGYYQEHISKMKQGYVHPYHSTTNPIVMSHMYYMKTLMDAVGPEQVSPHYESLSRSRRGLLFLAAYIGSVTTISRIGGWNHNEWFRRMLLQQEFILAFYLGFIEIRHFMFWLGPKFTIWYNVYSRYEASQMFLMWADKVEEKQLHHLVNTKEQMEYVNILKEYDYIKKRSLTNFLVNEKLNVEKHFHDRAVGLLKTIKKFEQENLVGHQRKIVTDALTAVQDALNDPTKGAEIRKASFNDALNGIRNGVMNYE